MTQKEKHFESLRSTGEDVSNLYLNRAHLDAAALSPFSPPQLNKGTQPSVPLCLSTENCLDNIQFLKCPAPPTTEIFRDCTRRREFDLLVTSAVKRRIQPWPR